MLTEPAHADRIIRLTREHVFVPWATQGTHRHIDVASAKGSYLYTASGEAYLDFSSQLVNVNIGHGHPRVIDAIARQAARLTYASPMLATEARAELAAALVAVAPQGRGSKVLFTTGGTEANENAIKMARQVTGRQKIITLYRSYHGGTYGAMTAGGDARRWADEPGIPGVVRALNPYPYRWPFPGEPGDPAPALRHVEDLFMYEGPGHIAAVLIEPVVGTNGVLVPPDGYLQGLRRLCDTYGALLICDEVMTGFGRIGRWFGCERWGVVPDLITFAKGVTAGYVPLGGVIVSPAVAAFFEHRPYTTGLTYSGHALACAAGLATLDVYRDEGLIERAATFGPMVGEALRALARHPSVGEVRGVGMFWALELVRNRDTREPLTRWGAPTSPEMAAVAEAILGQRLLVYVRWNNLIIAPPLNLSEAELAQGVAALDGALEVADRAVR